MFRVDRVILTNMANPVILENMVILSILKLGRSGKNLSCLLLPRKLTLALNSVSPGAPTQGDIRRWYSEEEKCV